MEPSPSVRIRAYGAAPEASPVMPSRLLIIDDDPLLRRILTLVLEQEGYVVETSAEGLDALARIESAPPALILVDISMPGLDGLELLRRLGNLPVVPPAIVVSARVDASRAARALGAVDFIAKPFDIEQLASVVARVLHTSSNGHIPDGR